MQDFLILDGEPDQPLYVGRKFSDIDILSIPLQQGYVPFPGALDEVRISNIRRPFGGVGEVYLGSGDDLAKPLPKGAFEADQHTVALWHFDDGRLEFSDSSGHNLTMFAHEGALNPLGLAVTPLAKRGTTWAHIRIQDIGTQ